MIMKKFFVLTAVAAMISLAIASCKSSQGGHCDAYGNVDAQENSDLASK
jgi:outer membrane lipoprotein SlyB